ncbi:luciferin 4-monooxygenase-like isoform X2 [Amblyomma americanum]
MSQVTLFTTTSERKIFVLETTGDFDEDVVIEDRVVKSTIQDLDIPRVDFATFLKNAWQKEPDMTAVIDAASGQRYTGADLEDACECISAGLQELGFEPGDMMAFVSANSVDLVQAFAAAIFAGSKIVCVKTGFNEREMTRLLKMTNPSVVYCDMANAEKTKQVCKNVPSVKALVVSGEYDGMVSFAKLKDTPRSQFQPPAAADPEDVLLVFQTSGSTGLPKAGLISHRNFIAELITFGYKNQGFHKGSVYLAYLPLMHASPLWLLFTMLTHHVESVVVAPTDLCAVLAPIPKYRVTTLILYPTHGQLIAQRGVPPSLDVSSVEAVYIGGSCVAPKVLRGLCQTFRGCIVVFGYGLTEVCCAISHTRGMCHDFKTVGIPMPYVSVKVVDVETSEKLGPGECGEICIKGPTCFKGYLDNPEATAAVFDEEGFVKSGDTGYYSARGELYVLDRIKDLIKCMDQQVAPAELEELLQEHPDVAQAAVAGVPHPEYGEAPLAFVVLDRRPETEDDERVKKVAITGYIKDLVAPHKQLHGGVEFVDHIPQTETGKPHRRELRDSYLQKKEAARGHAD